MGHEPDAERRRTLQGGLTVRALLLALGLLVAVLPAQAADVFITIEHPTQYEDGSPLPLSDIVTTRAFYSMDGTDWNSGGETSGAATDWTIRLPDFKCGRLHVYVRTVVKTLRESDPSDLRFVDVPCRPGQPTVLRIEIR